MKLNLRAIILLTTAFLTLCLCSCTTQAPVPPPDASVVSFDDVVFIENQGLKLGVAPSAGRIVYFGRADGANLLWLNKASEINRIRNGKSHAWVNYGGDKLWPTQQANWVQINGVSWPPDPSFDDCRWDLLRHSERQIVIQSPPIPSLGIRITRTMEISDDGHSALIRNRIERFAENPFPVQLWSITQIPLPPCGLMDIWPTQPLPGKPFIEWYKKGAAEALPDGRTLCHRPDADGKDVKTGTFGLWLAAIYKDYAFVQRSAANPHGCFPDRATLEVYSNLYYMEIETLGESKHLKPGESMENTVVWTLLPLDNQLSAEPELSALAERLQGLFGGKP